MWMETDHHGMVNLDYVKRVDLAGDMEKQSLGIYLFDINGETYPIVDVPRFKGIGVLKGAETDQDMHLAVYTFYTVARRLMAATKGHEVITIEAIYKEFAAEWYARQKEEIAKAEQKATHKKLKEGRGKTQDGAETASGNVHHLSDMKQFLDAYSASYLVKFKKKPVLHYENAGKIARELVKLYPLEKLKTMIKWYFDSDEDFITKAHYDIKTFRLILEKTIKAGASHE
jgi:hypothetical protein